MAKPAKPHNLSKKFLMGVALSAVPLAGCTSLEPPGDTVPNASDQTNVTATAEEAALFERARSLGTVAAAEQFLRAYPDSDLVRSLLTRLPRNTLRGIDEGVVDGIPQSMISSLPFSVKQALGVQNELESSGESRDSGASDGYSG